MNEFTENECLPKLELKFKILENLRKPLTQKYEKTHWLWKGFLSLRTGAARKIKWKKFGFAQVALAMRFKKNSLPDKWIPR